MNTDQTNMFLKSVTMAILFLVVLLISVRMILFLFTTQKKSKHALPPGPPSISHLGNLFWFIPSFSSLSPALRHLRNKYGPIVTLRAGSIPAIFISSGDLTYQTLVKKGKAFAFRPPSLGTYRPISTNHHTINFASYNTQWQLLRRNISSFLTTASSSSSFALRQSLDMLVQQLNHQAVSEGSIVVPSEDIQLAVFQYFTYLCFGVILDIQLLRDLRAVQLGMLGLAVKLRVFNLLPNVLMLLFLPRWLKLLRFRKRQEELIVPIITVRRQSCAQENYRSHNSYLDSLLALSVKENGRRLTNEEIVNLCSEFINAGTENTSTAIEWIMANLVRHETIQEKLFDSMEQFTKKSDQHVEMETVKHIPYLKAVVLEGLRRHPPNPLLLPHTVDKDINLDGYIIPRGAVINYVVPEIGQDRTVWEEPQNFMPERFLDGNEGMDMNTIIDKEKIKMIPFGAGLRACPGEGVAMLVLEYFVANLVWRFHWKRIENEDVDMTELPGLTVTMKHPLRTHLVSRTN